MTTTSQSFSAFSISSSSVTSSVSSTSASDSLSTTLVTDSTSSGMSSASAISASSLSSTEMPLPSSSSTTSATSTSTSHSSSTSISSTTTSDTSTTTSSTTFSSSTTSSSATTSTTVTTSSVISTSTPPVPPSRTTFQSTVFLTTTDSRGAQMTSAPSEITSTLVATESDGTFTTITQIGVNPTLSPDNGSPSDTFFRNTAAVAGVFVLVGLAAAAICLWIVFAIWRHRRTRLLEHDSTVSATLAAAGLYRAPLHDDDDFRMRGSKIGNSGIEMTHPGSRFTSFSQNSAGRGGSGQMDQEDVGAQDAFDPYSDYVVPNATLQDGYMAARTASPPLDHNNTEFFGRQRRFGHAASESQASNEPLLPLRERVPSHSPPAYFTTLPTTPSPPPPPPPRNPLRLINSRNSQSPSMQEKLGTRPSSHTSGGADDRLDPGLRQLGNDDLRDEEDYSRPVLAVRNLPDGPSEITDDLI